MAQKYLVQIVDDLKQEELEEGAGESVPFGVDVIDLSAENAAEFLALLGR